MLALANLVTHVPILIAVVVGAIAVLTRASRLPRRSVVLAMVSLGVTVLNVVLGVAWMTVSPQLAADMWRSSASTTSIALMYVVASVVLNLVAAVSLLLSFLAVAAAARPTDRAAMSPGFGTPPGSELPPQATPPGTAGFSTPGSPPPGSGWPDPPSA